MGYENLSLIPRAEWYHRSHPCDGFRKTVNGEGGQAATEEAERTGRACNINPFNKLIIDEIYRAFTVRGGGANALHLSRGNPGYISGLAPLRLDLRARANEPRPASATKRRWCRTMRQHTRALRLRRSAGVMGVAKNLSVGMTRKRKRGRVISARSTCRSISRGVQSNKERCFETGHENKNSKFVYQIDIKYISLTT